MASNQWRRSNKSVLTAIFGIIITAFIICVYHSRSSVVTSRGRPAEDYESSKSVGGDTLVIHQVEESAKIADQQLYAELSNGTLSAGDQRVIHFIRRRISKPSGLPINLADKTTGKTDFSIAGTSAFVDRLLGGKTGGFFIECGGADGETVSNSLFFELSRKWTGILIELNPNFFSQILAKHRNVYAFHACLSTKRSPSVMTVKPAGLSGGIAEEMGSLQLGVDFIRETQNIDVLCFPLNAIMNAIGIHDVDFMSLDVEGAEMAILRTIDFTRLNIKVLVVEYVLQGVSSLPDKGVHVRMERLSEIRRIMAATGLYKEVGTLPEGTNEKEGHDVVFQRV